MSRFVLYHTDITAVIDTHYIRWYFLAGYMETFLFISFEVVPHSSSGSDWSKAHKIEILHTQLLECQNKATAEKHASLIKSALRVKKAFLVPINDSMELE